MIYLKKSFFKIGLFVITLISILLINTNVFAIKSYQKLDFSTGLVTASSLNVRSGPSTAYSTVTRVNKNEYVRVFAQVGTWYIIQTDSDYIGAVSKQYIKPIYPNTSNNASNKTTTPNQTITTTNISLTDDEKETIDLINAERKKAGLSALSIDNELQRVARIKAQDMVDNNYFSHTSPTYGSPFDMMQSFKITYKTAGENIAGNSTNQGAVTAWMNSPGHKANILNSSFTHTGLGVVKSNKYGKIYVQMFIGR